MSPTSTPPTTAVAATAAPGHRTSSLAAVLVLLLAVVVPVRVTLVTSLAAPTVTVNSTDDDADATAGDGLCDTGQLNADGVAECTLRAALEEANASAVDDIAFAVPATDAGNTGGVVTITPASALPPITAATTVDARTQPGWSSTPVVVLDGSLSGAGPGLEVAVGPSVVAGFAVHSFATNGILVLTAADTTIRDNHVGVDETGVAAPGNGAAGVRIDGGAGNVVLDNVVGGNAVGGIAIKQGPDVVVHGNAVGVGTDGTTALGNAGPGIEVAVPNSSNVRIGGTAAGAGNTVAHNTGPGVTLRTGGVGNVSILSNSLHSNGGLGIDLNDDEVTANDPGDGGARGGGRAFDGRIDEVTVSHAARSDAWIAATHATQDQPGAAITVGATQTSASDGWTIDGSQARSGSSAALAPSGVLRSWLTLDGISEGGLEAMSWWRVSSLTGVDVGQGVRAGDAAGSGPVRQDETGLFGPAGWDLGQVDRARTQLVAPPAGQAPAVDTWQRVTVRIDQAAALSATAADTAIPSSGSTPAGVAPTGTIGFRVGSLDPTTRWWIDDLWVRRYVTPEPVATLRRTELAP